MSHIQTLTAMLNARKRQIDNLNKYQDCVPRIAQFRGTLAKLQQEHDAINDVLHAIDVAKTALNNAALELQAVWGQEEGDEPALLEALAVIRSLNDETPSHQSNRV